MSLVVVIVPFLREFLLDCSLCPEMLSGWDENMNKDYGLSREDTPPCILSWLPRSRNPAR